MTVIEEQDSANAALDSRGLPVTAVQLGISITLSVKCVPVTQLVLALKYVTFLGDAIAAWK